MSSKNRTERNESSNESSKQNNQNAAKDLESFTNSAPSDLSVTVGALAPMSAEEVASANQQISEEDRMRAMMAEVEAYRARVAAQSVARMESLTAALTALDAEIAPIALNLKGLTDRRDAIRGEIRALQGSARHANVGATRTVGAVGARAFGHVSSGIQLEYQGALYSPTALAQAIRANYGAMSAVDGNAFWKLGVRGSECPPAGTEIVKIYNGTEYRAIVRSAVSAPQAAVA